MKLKLVVLAALTLPACGVQSNDKRVNNLDQDAKNLSPLEASIESVWEKCFDYENEGPDGKYFTSSKTVYNFAKESNSSVTINMYADKSCQEKDLVETTNASMSYQIEDDKIQVFAFERDISLRFKLDNNKLYISTDPEKAATIDADSEFTKQ